MPMGRVGVYADLCRPKLLLRKFVLLLRKKVALIGLLKNNLSCDTVATRVIAILDGLRGCGNYG